VKLAESDAEPETLMIILRTWPPFVHRAEVRTVGSLAVFRLPARSPSITIGPVQRMFAVVIARL
jgi:hypothetical protein